MNRSDAYSCPRCEREGSGVRIGHIWAVSYVNSALGLPDMVERLCPLCKGSGRVFITPAPAVTYTRHDPLEEAQVA